MEFIAFLQLRLFVAMGWHMQALVVSWYVYALTHDPLMLAMIGLAEAVPAIGFALPMGYFVDRMDKRTGIRIALMMIIVSGVTSAIFVQPWVAKEYGNAAVVAGLMAMIFVNGSARAIYSPSMFSALGQIVPRDQIARSSALSSTMWQGAMIAGPLLGGLVYGVYGVGIAAIVFVALLVLGATGALRLSPKPPVEQTERRSMKKDLTMGIRFIFSRPAILGALSLDLFAVLFGGVIALLPVFAHDILHVGESGLGLLRASMSIGSVAMMAFLSWKPLKRNAGRILLWSVAGFGVSILAFSASTVFALSVAILVFAGAFDAVSVVIRHTILQLETPDNMKGRVAAANTMFISSSNELGAVESGIAAKLFGTAPSVVLGGVMTLLVVGLVAWKNPTLRKLDMK